MRFRLRSICCLIPVLALSAQGAISLATDQESSIAGGTTPLTAEASGPAKAAMDAFREGNVQKAIEIARPLAAQGDAEAQYLMGFAHETGRGAEASAEQALDFYRKAAAGGYQDSVYRLALILLASEKEEDRQEARKLLENAAKTDAPVAGRFLGEAYLKGAFSEKPDTDKAVFWWSRAGDEGDAVSLLLLGRLYEGEFGFPELVNAKTAMGYYAKAAGLGNANAMLIYGSRLLNGDKSVRDEAEGREWLQKAIDAKVPAAYLVLGDFEDNVKKDPKAALAAYEAGHREKQVDSTLRAADFYLEGKGTEKDEKKATELLKSAAEAGSPIAHFRLAAAELSSEKGDVVSGYGHLLSAANGGLTEAQNELGLFYLTGRLGATDAAASVAWLTQAAKGGFAPAQNNLAALFERGAGVTANIENAGRLYTLAANQGHGGATLALARLISGGIGTTADPAKGWALATLAAERGEEDGKKLAEQLEGSFDAAAKAKAKEELEALKSGKPAAGSTGESAEPAKGR